MVMKWDTFQGQFPFPQKGQECCEVTGMMVNHVTEFDLEIVCVCQFYGGLAYIERLENLLLLVKNL